MNKELGPQGIKSTALCPAFVDTPMTDFIKQSIAADKMIRATDVSEAVRMLLRLSPGCVIPEIAQVCRVPSELTVWLPEAAVVARSGVRFLGGDLLAQQAGLEVGAEDEQLALGGPAALGLPLAAEGHGVPRLREGDLAGAAPVAMGGE